MYDKIEAICQKKTSLKEDQWDKKGDAMSFRRIEYFLSVAKHLNFTKAARECYVAQAAISQQIKQFEQELGFPLFDRGGASVRLTEPGEYFYHQCQSVMAQYRGAVKRARTIYDGEKKVLRVGFNSPYPHQKFMDCLRRYREKEPSVLVSIREGYRQTLLENLQRGDLDLVVVPDYGMPMDQRFDTQELASGPVHFIIGKDTALAGRSRIQPAELTGLTMFWVEDDHAEREPGPRKMPEYYARLGLGDNPVQTVHSYFEAMLMVEAGLGFAALPMGAEKRMPEDVSVFRIVGDTFRVSTVAVRARPTESVTADDIFRMLRQADEDSED